MGLCSSCLNKLEPSAPPPPARPITSNGNGNGSLIAIESNHLSNSNNRHVSSLSRSNAISPVMSGQAAMAISAIPLTLSSPVSPTASSADVSRKIDESLLIEHKAMGNIIKLLLLGPAESGKSTVLKQMRIIHLNGFSSEELWSRRPLIFHNATQSIAQLLHGLKSLSLRLPPQLDPFANLILSLHPYNDPSLLHLLPDHIYSALKVLWKDPTIQEAYERRSEFYLMDCCKYFLDDLDRLKEKDYLPTTNDILYARAETIGVVEIRYQYKKMEFRIFDVGGQRTERRKWLHIFDNVNAIFFIAAISEYDQMMREDNSTNRLHDSIELFRNIGNNPLFARIQIILFLNKKDLFMDKIGRIPLTACFPNYRYKNDYKNAVVYVTKKFEQQIRDKQKMIYTHLTQGTDTGGIQFVTNSVTDMIIAENFKQSGIY